MDNASAPIKITVLWAEDATSPYIVFPVPTSGSGLDPGRASFQFGFPPLTFTSIGSGGVPPFGSDFNGAMQQVTADVRFIQSGAIPTWDSTFATAIGGHPQDAVVRHSGSIWRSTAENNTSEPGVANWVTWPINPPVGVPDGGTGVVSFTAGAVLIGNGTGPISVELPLSTQRGGTGTTSPTSNAVVVGNGTSPLQYAVPSGTLPLVGTGGPPAFAQLDLNANASGGASINVKGVLPVANAPVLIIAIYPTPGVYTFTVPADRYWLYGQVAGGGGGGAAKNPGLGTGASGGGGAAGGYAEGWFAVIPGQNITITVGAGGTTGDGVSTFDGTNGGNSSIGAFMSGTGGDGGNGDINVAGGIPGVGVVAGTGLQVYGGYGGSGNLTDPVGQAGGSGGASFFGGGIYAPQNNASPASNAALGAGGGGGWGGTTPALGTVGMPGCVIIRG